jgi:hypothetical protein
MTNTAIGQARRQSRPSLVLIISQRPAHMRNERRIPYECNASSEGIYAGAF